MPKTRHRNSLVAVIGIVVLVLMVLGGAALVGIAALGRAGSPAVAERNWGAVWPTLAFPPTPATLPTFVTREYDKFKDETTFQTEFRDFSAGKTMTLSVSEKGDVAHLTVPPYDVQLITEESELIFLADGARLHAKFTNLGSFHWLMIRTEDILTIMNASKVEAKMNGDEFTVTDDMKAKLRAFASLLH